MSQINKIGVIYFFIRTVAFSERAYLFLLGHRDMVDPDAHHTWRMAARLLPIPLALQSAVLGRSLPAGNVHGLHPQALRGDWRSVDRGNPQRIRLRCHGCMATDLRGDDACYFYKFATIMDARIESNSPAWTGNPGTTFCFRRNDALPP